MILLTKQPTRVPSQVLGMGAIDFVVKAVLVVCGYVERMCTMACMQLYHVNHIHKPWIIQCSVARPHNYVGNVVVR